MFLLAYGVCKSHKESKPQDALYNHGFFITEVLLRPIITEKRVFAPHSFAVGRSVATIQAELLKLALKDFFYFQWPEIKVMITFS